MEHAHIQIAKKVLREEAEALLQLSENLDQNFSKAVEYLFNCKGKVIITGLGKSGLVGRKIAATLASLGTPSIFVHPTEAYHGDLGIVDSKDVCIAISNSGDTEDILRLIPSFKIFGVPIIGICSNTQSELSKISDVVLKTGVTKEACSLNLAPTTSTTVTMAIGDALAVALVNAKGFTEKDFAFLHPGGTLGKKLLSRVTDVLIPPEKTGTAKKSDGIKTLANQLSTSNLGIVVILEESGKIAGVVTDGDLRRALQKPDFQNLTAQAIMSANPKTISCDSLLAEAVRKAELARVTALVATSADGKYQGIVNLHDILNKKML